MADESNRDFLALRFHSDWKAFDLMGTFKKMLRQEEASSAHSLQK